jgi:hypothetical protein
MRFDWLSAAARGRAVRNRPSWLDPSIWFYLNTMATAMQQKDEKRGRIAAGIPKK